MYTFNYISKILICSTKQLYPWWSICCVAWHVCNGYSTVTCITACKSWKHISNDFSLGRWVIYKFNYMFEDFMYSTKQLYHFSSICFIAWPVFSRYTSHLCVSTLQCAKLKIIYQTLFRLVDEYCINYIIYARILFAPQISFSRSRRFVSSHDPYVMGICHVHVYVHYCMQTLKTHIKRFFAWQMSNI